MKQPMVSGDPRAPWGSLAPSLVSPTRDAGLCASCGYARVVQGANTKFALCERSVTDPAYPRYPVLPQRRCPGYAADSMPPKK